MGSIGQMDIGYGAIGASQPTACNLKNVDEVQAFGASFILTADHVEDINEHVWFEAAVLDKYQQPIHAGTFHQHTDPGFNIPKVETLTINPDAEVVLTSALNLTPNETYWIKVRSTTDPVGEQAPSLLRWWTQWKWFKFKPILSAWDVSVENFFMWENLYVDGGKRRKDVQVPYGGNCFSSQPYFEWEFPYDHDYFAWTITKHKSDQYLSHKTRNMFVDTKSFPQFDGTWWFRIAPVWGGVVGQVYEHKFTTKGTEILVD